MRQAPSPEERLAKARKLVALQDHGLDEVLDDVEKSLMEKWISAKTEADDKKLCAERDGLKALRQRLSSEISMAKKIQLDEEAVTKATPRKKKGS